MNLLHQFLNLKNQRNFETKVGTCLNFTFCICPVELCVVCSRASMTSGSRRYVRRTQCCHLLRAPPERGWDCVSFHGKKYASLEQTTLTWSQSCARLCSFSHLWVEIEGIMTQKTPTQQIFQATNQNHTSKCIT